MQESRRRLFMAFVGVAGALAATPALRGLQASPTAKTYPSGRDPNRPEMDKPTALDPKAIEQANQQEFKKDVARLYSLVSELKAQVEKTDTIFVFSLSVLKQAQEIEKLAKRVKGLAKG